MVGNVALGIGLSAMVTLHDCNDIIVWYTIKFNMVQNNCHVLVVQFPVSF